MRPSSKLPDTISWWEAFYKVIRRIPHGRVCTYGAVAAMAGHPRAARHVGNALNALNKTGEDAGVPWQRVVGSRSRNKAAISIKDPVGGGIQRMMLEAEGVEFDKRGNISLDRFGWFQSTPVRAPAAKKAARTATKPGKAAARGGRKGAAKGSKQAVARPRKRRAG